MCPDRGGRRTGKEDDGRSSVQDPLYRCSILQQRFPGVFLLMGMEQMTDIWISTLNLLARVFLARSDGNVCRTCQVEITVAIPAGQRDCDTGLLNGNHGNESRRWKIRSLLETHCALVLDARQAAHFRLLGGQQGWMSRMRSWILHAYSTK